MWDLTPEIPPIPATTPFLAGLALYFFGGTLSPSWAAHLICRATFRASLHVSLRLTHIRARKYSVRVCVCVWQKHDGRLLVVFVLLSKCTAEGLKKIKRCGYVKILSCMCVCHYFRVRVCVSCGQMAWLCYLRGRGGGSQEGQQGSNSSCSYLADTITHSSSVPSCLYEDKLSARIIYAAICCFFWVFFYSSLCYCLDVWLPDSVFVCIHDTALWT